MSATPLLSMTGYGAANGLINTRHWFVELRSVNGRYLDVNVRVPDEFRAMEIPLQRMLAAKLLRGKIDCNLSYQWYADSSPQETLSERSLQGLRGMQDIVLKVFPEAPPLRVDEILRWPGILADGHLAQEHESYCMMLLEEALARLLDTLQREGVRLKEILLQYCDQAKDIITAIKPRLPEAIAKYRSRLQERLSVLDQPVDEEALLREVMLFAQRSDVDEEVSRLSIHLDEFCKILKSSAPGGAGKRLDFLCQELNREANTLSAKSASLPINSMALAMKVLIDKMREQVQNVA